MKILRISFQRALISISHFASHQFFVNVFVNHNLGLSMELKVSQKTRTQQFTLLYCIFESLSPIPAGASYFQSLKISNPKDHNISGVIFSCSHSFHCLVFPHPFLPLQQVLQPCQVFLQVWWGVLQWASVPAEVLYVIWAEVLLGDRAAVLDC